ncbi:probable 37S ribosomal protein S26, mitochondrial [Zygosaccharomyces bailii]|uniref:ZYBA0S06-04742g1_1 n=1 Tax=Zygosaccharomyces bailii (strain CLIB 213 / ATCC 58445 / CBS 680 / BCRC 21525 / NBRC 1098 / NCYC 1416 / NRRL Y-2227) TaxID=1333698 RepID=A0A8J2XBN5_ZYGB2|nr:ZYBA0S06-04742g1_1 [Zygosaccharomyces bailii CLIB 213]SJM84642.1 probable 37S ribosomal protein S26, mitochondrial [Zygosaccharomyces bailii]
MLRPIICKRSIHALPRLPNVSTLQQQGIPNVLSAKGFQILWNQHQKYLCDKLTLATNGTSMESYLPFHLLLNTAKRPFQSNVFNLASAAHNNHLFVENILPPSNDAPTEPSRLFLSRIQDSFNSDWESVKEEMVHRSEQEILGQGWLFLVENANKELHILLTQNNGTPYYFPRNQLFDLNSALTLEEFAQIQQIKDIVKSRGDQKVEDWTIPLISISLWDQAYLHDYGVKNRTQYVKHALDNLNWSVVNNRLYSNQLAQ